MPRKPSFEVTPPRASFSFIPDAEFIRDGTPIPCVTLRTTANGCVLIGLESGDVHKVNPATLRSWDR